MSDREDRLADRLGARLASERAASDRNWRMVSAAVAERHGPRRGALGEVIGIAALAAAVVVAVGWWQGARVEVAAGALPVLYREEVARTAIAAPGVDATVAIVQKHIEGDAGLRVVGVTDVRLASDRLPATIELRFQGAGDDSYGVLAHSEVGDPRRATGSTRTLYEAPFPPSVARARATYRVWLHLETGAGTLESPIVVIQVTDRPEGQRASTGAAP